MSAKPFNIFLLNMLNSSKNCCTGLAFHKDLALRVTKNEAYKVTEMIRMHAQEVLPGTIAKLSGGFSR